MCPTASLVGSGIRSRARGDPSARSSLRKYCQKNLYRRERGRGRPCDNSASMQLLAESLSGSPSRELRRVVGLANEYTDFRAACFEGVARIATCGRARKSCDLIVSSGEALLAGGGVGTPGRPLTSLGFAQPD